MFEGITYLQPHILFHSNGLAMVRFFQIIKLNYGQKSAILNLIKLTFFIAYPSLKLYILIYNNGVPISHGILGIDVQDGGVCKPTVNRS